MSAKGANFQATDAAGEDEFFCSGVSETALAKLQSLRVLDSVSLRSTEETQILSSCSESEMKSEFFADA